MVPHIRLASNGDAGAIAAIYAPIVISTPISFELDPPDEAEMRRRIQYTLPAYPWLVCEIDGQVAGYAYGGQHRARPAYRWSVEVSVYVAAALQRRGIGRGLYLSLFEVLAAQGYWNAYAGITLPNAGSVGVHEAAGFEPIGVFRNIGYKFGVWHDVGWWQRPLRPPGTPEEPVSLGEVQRDPAWERMLRTGMDAIRAVSP